MADKMSRIKTLIVDDTESIRMLVKEYVDDLGWATRLAEDGEVALRRIGEEKPEVVLMDIGMPNMNGIECCRAIKSNDALTDIKVIMVTARDEYEKVKEAFDAGCDDYVTKPIDRDELHGKLKEIGELVRFRRHIQDLEKSK
jgi:twitching motility two-component system response regulator PilH